MKSEEFIWTLSVICFSKEITKLHRRKHFRNDKKCITSYDYPLEIESFDLGFFSGRDRAEKFMKDSSQLIWLCSKYIIKNFLLGSYEINTGYNQMINNYVYNSDGSFYDGSEMVFIGEKVKYHFTGKDKNKQKFKKGDIVEFISNDQICLGIIYGYSGDKDHIESAQKKKIKTFKKVAGKFVEYSDTFRYDISDDSYVVLQYDSEGDGEEGKTPHEHILSFYVFEPKGYIPEEIKSILKAGINL